MSTSIVPKRYWMRLHLLRKSSLIWQRVLRRWDPIGVEPGISGPADEYDSYAPHIVTMVLGGASAHDVALLFGKLRVQSIGLSAELASDEAFALEVIEALRLWLA